MSAFDPKLPLGFGRRILRPALLKSAEAFIDPNRQGRFYIRCEADAIAYVFRRITGAAAKAVADPVAHNHDFAFAGWTIDARHVDVGRRHFVSGNQHRTCRRASLCVGPPNLRRILRSNGSSKPVLPLWMAAERSDINNDDSTVESGRSSERQPRVPQMCSSRGNQKQWDHCPSLSQECPLSTQNGHWPINAADRTPPAG